ncbi:DUF488 family protein [Microbacterium immunditiarum]|uniref:Uncharacterized protein YeaO (DUF488 family) n=1 Tax=Microbacterium immunditiarum TaxID=337480 RepID=A0A7Y9GMY6_9MICO|nr:DUF488 domain-containing protein [Microbacterium immunditiarum]NYE19455.1 uncharacterized protein YeaO (DUF488 family) [Microbacterium immunditiarum]
MVELEALSLGELQALRLGVLREIRRRSGELHACTRCGIKFIARAGARFCSTKCRTAAHRAAKNKEAPRVPKILGFGYEGQTVDALVAKLRLHGIDVLVDVRLNAISRKRGFSKTGLAAALHEAGIDYLHKPELGNHRDNREGYATTDTDVAHAARDRFREVLLTERADAALQEVAKLARTQTIALFCFEADERHCHREQVREALSAHVNRDLLPV